MYTFKPWLFSLACSLVLCGLMAWAGQPTLAQSGAWQAVYWDNLTLAGEPILMRGENEIDHNWGLGSPDPLLPVDRFSARWTGRFDFAPGRYRFSVTADDGARLWINGQQLLDEWTVQSEQTYEVEITLAGGSLPVQLDYFEDTNLAVIRLNWTRVADDTDRFGTGAGDWWAEYFNNIHLQGLPALTRPEASISFRWGGSSPAPGIINPDSFSARWTRTLTLPAGQYRFTTETDDGVRLWVNNRLILDRWQIQSPTASSAEIYLNGGPTPIRMEYFENLGGALAELDWVQADGATPQTPPLAAGAPVNLWLGEYFNNTTLSGNPALVRNDPEISFGWGTGSPVSQSIRENQFSVRWTRTLNLTPGRYRFSARYDDGLRLWVDGQLLLNDWLAGSVRERQAEVEVVGETTPVRVEYFDDTGIATAQLSWRRIGEGAALESPTGERTVTVTGAQYLNVRSGPGVQFSPIGYLMRGQTVIVVGRSTNAEWLQVQLANGETGWINRRYLAGTSQLLLLPLISR
jgi:hypothetical protein